jgi:gag-polypeptide of LTR copia-type
LSLPTDDETKALNAWQEKEDTAMYLLSQKLADLTLIKYMWKTTVTEMWSAIVLEFTQKSMLVHLNMHLKFMAMHCMPGANLHTELDQVCVEYETLLNADVMVTDNDYCTLIINFLPSHLTSFIAQISANTKAITMVQHAASTANLVSPIAPLDQKMLEMSPEAMMTLTLEEYDCQLDKRPPKPKDASVAASTIASEKPGLKTRGGRGGKGKSPQKPKGVCWNCGGKGHKSDVCPSPKMDEKLKDTRADPKGSRTLKPAAKSQNTAASATLDEVAGAWSTFNSPDGHYVDTIYNGSLWELVLPHSLHIVSDSSDDDKVTDPDMPDLIPLDSLDEGDDNRKHHAVTIHVGQCHNDDLRKDPPDNDDPDIAGILELDEHNNELLEAHIVDQVANHVAAVSTDGEDDDPLGPMDVPALVAEWDMMWSKPLHASLRSLVLMALPPTYSKGQIWEIYDSGASHHMSPICDDFMEFQSTTPKSLTAANQQEFHLSGIGDVLISVPNGQNTTTIHLTSVLYTPSIGMTLILVGWIDNAGYMCLFGKGCCKIHRSDRELVGVIPKRQALYQVIRDVEKPSAHIARPTKITVMDLHCCMGHIAPHAACELVVKGR